MRLKIFIVLMLLLVMVSFSAHAEDQEVMRAGKELEKAGNDLGASVKKPLMVARELDRARETIEHFRVENHNLHRRITLTKEALDVIHDLGRVAAPVPYVGEVAGGIGVAAGVAADALKLPKEATGDIDSLLNKVEEGAKPAFKVTHDLVSVYGSIESVSEAMIKTGKAASSAERESTADLDACIAKTLRDVATFGNNSAKEIMSFNKVFVRSANELKTIFNKFDEDIKPIAEAEEKITEFSKHISGIEDAMHKLDRELKKKVGIRIKYPSPTWKNPLRTRHLTVGISTKTALKGIKHIEDALVDSLLGPEITILKAFGLNKIAKELQSAAHGNIEPILKELKVFEKIKIPGISELIDGAKTIESTLHKMTSKFEKIASLNVPKIDFNTYKHVSYEKIKSACQ